MRTPNNWIHTYTQLFGKLQIVFSVMFVQSLLTNKFTKLFSAIYFTTIGKCYNY